MPVNHVAVVRADVARDADAVRWVLERFRAARTAVPLTWGRRALTPAIRLAVRYGVAQGLLARELGDDAVWAGLPPGCHE